jgi:hypothetical protein
VVKHDLSALFFVIFPTVKIDFTVRILLCIGLNQKIEKNEVLSLTSPSEYNQVIRKRFFSNTVMIRKTFQRMLRAYILTIKYQNAMRKKEFSLSLFRETVVVKEVDRS